MSLPSPLDLAEMRAMVARLERVIAEATDTVAELKAAIAAAEASPASVTAAPAANPLVDAATPAPDRPPRPTPWSKRRPAATAAGHAAHPTVPATAASRARNTTTSGARAAKPQPATRDTAAASAADIRPGGHRATTPPPQTTVAAAPLHSRPGDLRKAAEPGLSTPDRPRPVAPRPATADPASPSTASRHPGTRTTRPQPTDVVASPPATALERPRPDTTDPATGSGDTAPDRARRPAPPPSISPLGPGLSAAGQNSGGTRTPNNPNESPGTESAASGPSALDGLPEALRSLRVPTVGRPQGGVEAGHQERDRARPGPNITRRVLHRQPRGRLPRNRRVRNRLPRTQPPLDRLSPNQQPPSPLPANRLLPTNHSPPNPLPHNGKPARRTVSQRLTTAQLDQSPRSDGHPLLAELAERHGLTLVGFDDAPLDASNAREFAEAVGDMLTRYPITLQGIEIRSPAGAAPPRTLGAAALPRADPAPLWLILDSTALVPWQPHGPTFPEVAARASYCRSRGVHGGGPGLRLRPRRGG